jgi:5-methylcytosine-specific restriction endonuclease McrA
MNPQPKLLRINLMPKEKTLLRDKIYRKQHQCCDICFKWFKYNMLDMHHRKLRSQGGDDSEENCILVCRGCHNDIHDGKFMQDRR